MAKKTVEELQAALDAAKALELEATEGLGTSQTNFEAAYEGIVDGTPEQLEELRAAFSEFVTVLKANWRYRGMPTMTAERRAKAIEATKKSKAKREAMIANGETPPKRGRKAQAVEA